MRSGCKPLRRWACSPLGSGREAGDGNSHKSRQTLWRNRIWCIAGKLGLIMCSSYNGQPLGCRVVPHAPRSPWPQAPFHSKKRCTSHMGAFVSRSWSSGTRYLSLGLSPRQVPARPPEAEFALNERSLWEFSGNVDLWHFLGKPCPRSLSQTILHIIFHLWLNGIEYRYKVCITNWKYLAHLFNIQN